MKPTIVANTGLRILGIVAGWFVGASFGAGSGGIAGAGLFSAIGAVVGFFIIPDLKWLFRKIPVIGEWGIFKGYPYFMIDFEAKAAVPNFALVLKTASS